ncbi:2-succinyl-5-enolpyruvyl-6-hydroxy-3-cyclohexene-1-carboxylic-acid synthase [Minicystis rosea]|nr:2-succinyl-5-enolpyruvyl-6-hydroxy-3-cyclohexene-1-carboxylic-acid synthase [Minicystis rosea]
MAWAKLFVRAAAAAGVTEVVLSPGSRSTPLAIAAAEEPGVRLHVVVDERSAGFFALGQARVTGRPSMLVCTSGTAGAHYLPAIIEAAQSFVPMLAVTADRPWELYDAAAPQTIDQAKMFGDFVRHYAELGLPDAAPSAIRAVPRVAAQAVARALGPTPGPVHVNARFRKPLEPVRTAEPEAWEPLVASLATRGAPAVHAPVTSPDPKAIDEIVERALRAERGLIVCGPAPLAQAKGRDAILELARRTGFPLLAEATSQVRFGGERAGVVTCSAFDAILRVPAARGRLAPDLILEMGTPPTSSAYAELLAQSPGAARIVIAPHGWNDPQNGATAFVVAEPGAVARAVAGRLPARIGAAPPWAASFARADALASTVIDRALAADFCEGAVARALVSSCPERALLAVGNSTPVRDLDAYCAASTRDLRVLHQRGASGIDGLVSGVAGARSVAADPVALLLGDLSLLHDLTGLALLAEARAPLVVVVVQNGGGRIFEQLPVVRATDAAVFDRCFATPVPVRFEQAAAAFGVSYARAETAVALDEALARAWSGKGATLVEAVVPPHGGAAIAARIRAELAKELGA